MTSSRPTYWLFGYPISHSAAPTLHNTITKAIGLPNHFGLHDAEDPAQAELQRLIRAPDFGGAAVTMPLKVTMMPFVDRLEPEAKEIGSINTIILERNAVTGNIDLVGQNYDWQGVRNSIRSALPPSIQSNPHPFGPSKCTFIIGGGGTTRAAVFALSNLGLSPIFLINRDQSETAAVVEHFPQYDLRPLLSPEEWKEEWQDKVACGVGAIPSFVPVTDAEKNVYAIAHKIFDGKNSDGRERYLLEMCYKPRRTTILEAAEAAGWNVIQGIEAMIEQGVAQQRAWLFNSVAAPFAPEAEKEKLSAEVIDKARVVVREMDDIKVPATKAAL